MAISPWALASIALGAIGALIYLVVAYVLSKRVVSSGARGAQRGFVLWWAGLGALGIYGLIFNDTYGISVLERGLGTFLVVLYVLLLVIYAALGGLLYYLLYLYTGNAKMLAYTVVFYVFMTGFLVWFLHGSGGSCIYPDEAAAGCLAPDTWSEGDGLALSSFEKPSVWVGAAFSLLLVGPPLAAAIMYFLLFFRVDDPTSKYRVACISGGIILWFSFSVINSVFGAVAGADAGRDDVTSVVSQLLGALSGVLVLLAYYPPKWVRKRWAVRALGDARA